MRERFGEAYTEAEVEDDEYEGVAGTTTIGVPNLLMVSEDMPDDLAERITQALYEGKDRLADDRPGRRVARPRRRPGDRRRRSSCIRARSATTRRSG